MKSIERLQQYIEYKEIRMKSFDSAIGVEDGYTEKHIKNKEAIGSDILENIFSRYPDLNPTWLLAGKGTMLIHKASVKEAGSDHQINTPYIAALLDKLPVDHIIAYIHENEKRRGFDKSKMYELFLEVRLQRKVYERMKDVEKSVEELSRKVENGR